MHTPSAHPDSEPTLVHRIERLETSARRWRATALGLALAGLAAISGGWRPATEEVEASRFVLRGAQGEEAGVLGLDSQGRPSLLLRQDKAYAFLTLSGPGLLLRGDDGKRSAFMGFDNEGGTELNLTSSRGADGIRLEVSEDGSSGVRVLGENSFPRASLSYSAKSGTSSVLTNDDRGRVRTSLGLERGDTPSLVLIDEGDVRRIGLLVDPEENGLPFLGLQDEKGRGRLELTTSFDGTPILALRRTDGTPAFQAP